MSTWRQVMIDCNPVFKGRGEEMGFAYCPHRWCLKMHIRWLRGKAATDQKKKKSFQKSFSVCRANGFLPFQETLSHPLLKPLLEDPKMELKTFLLPLRLGLLTAFHQSAEVNIFTMKVFPPSVSSFSFGQSVLFKKPNVETQQGFFFFLFTCLNMPLKQGQAVVYTCLAVKWQVDKHDRAWKLSPRLRARGCTRAISGC